MMDLDELERLAKSAAEGWQAPEVVHALVGEIPALVRELSALREVAEAAGELADLVIAVACGEYEINSFTAQPIVNALAKYDALKAGS